MRLLMSGLGALIVVGICGLGAFLVVAEQRRTQDTAEQRRTQGTAAAPQESARGTGTHAVDARPLSLEEVFPSAEIRPAPGAAVYRVGTTHIDTDCETATTGALGFLLDSAGCTQVVRAGLTAPYNDYQVTAGVFSLPDEAGTVALGDQVGRQVAAGDGSFAPMVAPPPAPGPADGAKNPGGDPAILPLAQVGWHSRGHFLLYCVIAGPDGRPIRDGDRYARRIAVDLVESYLGNTVIGRRASSP
jgi:hypothetical protein